MAVDSTSVYWSNFYSGTIGHANLNGTGVKQNLITKVAEPVGLAVDSAHVYWANFLVRQYRASQPRRLGRQPELRPRQRS